MNIVPSLYSPKTAVSGLSRSAQTVFVHSLLKTCPLAGYLDTSNVGTESFSLLALGRFGDYKYDKLVPS